MPINSFEDYPMSFAPGKQQLKKPYYLSLFGLLHDYIINGQLAPYTKLPPQRELADYLDINLSTVTKAYKMCELKGLIYATVGKGTFVSPNGSTHPLMLDGTLTNHIELGSINPMFELGRNVQNSVNAVIKSTYASELTEYNMNINHKYHEEASLKWIRRFHIRSNTENILITSGIQNGLSMILTSLFHAGDKIATDSFTYPNFKGLANLLNIQLIPIANDDDGMLPEKLNSACKAHNIKGIYLMPTISNPTGIIIPENRREDLSTIIKRHNLILIEDDSFGFLAPTKNRPISDLLPDHSIYLCGTSKSLNMGFGIAFMICSERFKSTLLLGNFYLNLHPVILNVNIISELIHKGIADKIVDERIRITSERNAIFQKYFPSNENTINTYFHWIRLPEHMDCVNIEYLAKKKGINILSARRFVIGNDVNCQHIRVAICSPKTNQELEHGLQCLHSLLYDNHNSAMDLIL